MRIEPTGDVCGAVVQDVDLVHDQPSGADLHALVRALDQHLVLIVPGQADLDDARQQVIASWFGALYVPPGDVPVLGDREQRPTAFVSNVADHPGVLGDIELPPHSDLHFVQVPPAASLLYAIEVPADGSGATGWGSLHHAYETLDPEDRELADRLTALVHNPYAGVPAAYQPDIGTQWFTEEPVPPARHPLVRTHPGTGRRALYLSPGFHTVLVDEDGEKVDGTVLERFQAHVGDDAHYHTHHWTPGDLVIWDNRATVHRREAFDPASRRVMRRCMTAGSRPF